MIFFSRSQTSVDYRSQGRLGRYTGQRLDREGMMSADGTTSPFQPEIPVMATRLNATHAIDWRGKIKPDTARSR